MKNDSHCLAITTRSGKATIDLLLFMVDDIRNSPIDIDDAYKDEIENLVTNNELS